MSAAETGPNPSRVAQSDTAESDTAESDTYQSATTGAATEARFARRLAVHLPESLPRPEVQFGRARTTPVQVRWSPHETHVRLHSFFHAAPDDVVAALGKWLVSGRRARKAGRRLDEWIAEQLALLPARPRRRRQARAQGEVHDLEHVAAELLVAPFVPELADPAARPAISWGRRVRSRSRRSLQLGSYVAADHLVRVHPVLDQRAVPRWFVRYVLFHELLHAALDGDRNDGRAPVLHGPAFRNRELAYPDYEHALHWERENIARLIRSARDGSRLTGDRAREDSPRVRRSWLQRALF